jgi:hypothetical protein
VCVYDMHMYVCSCLVCYGLCILLIVCSNGHSLTYTCVPSGFKHSFPTSVIHITLFYCLNQNQACVCCCTSQEFCVVFLCVRFSFKVLCMSRVSCAPHNLLCLRTYSFIGRSSASINWIVLECFCEPYTENASRTNWRYVRT